MKENIFLEIHTQTVHKQQNSHFVQITLNNPKKSKHKKILCCKINI